MIEEIKKALGEATIGPWDFAVFEDSRHVIYDNTYFNRHIAEIVRGGVENEQREEDNAYLIANAPEWLRYLIGEVEETKRYKDALRKIVCLNVPMPDEVFNIANGALEEIEE